MLIARFSNLCYTDFVTVKRQRKSGAWTLVQMRMPWQTTNPFMQPAHFRLTTIIIDSGITRALIRFQEQQCAQSYHIP